MMERGDPSGASGPALPENQKVADALDVYAQGLEKRGSPSYRSRAYRRAAGTVAALPSPIGAVHDLRALPGIGAKISKVIGEILAGTWSALDELPASAPEPPGVQAMIRSLRGDLHAHTHATDGRDSIRAMAAAGQRRGYEYLAITDHSQETRIAGGLSAEDMRIHMARIRRADEEADGIRLLAGAEVDILRDGRLDFPDGLLQDLDVVVCSVHFRHGLSPHEQTLRILEGMSNDNADILGHPTTRRKGIRPGLALDLEAIAQASGDQGWAIELNGAPERRDLCADDARLVAGVADVRFTIDSDAHSIGELHNVRHSCAEAVAAGLDPTQVLNTLPLADFERALRS